MKIKQELGREAELIVVSKNRSLEEIMQAYHSGQRSFAENKVQVLLEREPVLPKDIEWHMIGHLQSNKVKYITPFIHCIQSVDSMSLLQVINKESQKSGRITNCLLQIYIAGEETKFGMSREECLSVLEVCSKNTFPNLRITGFMGMASNTPDASKIRREFSGLKEFYDTLREKHGLKTLSMGMSSDYSIALENGSNMVRIGSKVFE